MSIKRVWRKIADVIWGRKLEVPRKVVAREKFLIHPEIEKALCEALLKRPLLVSSIHKAGKQIDPDWITRQPSWAIDSLRD